MGYCGLFMNITNESVNCQRLHFTKPQLPPHFSLGFWHTRVSEFPVYALRNKDGICPHKLLTRVRAVRHATVIVTSEEVLRVVCNRQISGHPATKKAAATRLLRHSVLPIFLNLGKDLPHISRKTFRRRRQICIPSQMLPTVELYKAIPLIKERQGNRRVHEGNVIPCGYLYKIRFYCKK